MFAFLSSFVTFVFTINYCFSASANSGGHDSMEPSDGYWDMRPGSIVNSPASQNENYMPMTPTSSSNSGAYMSMTPPKPAASSGYIEMTPGQKCKLFSAF